MIPAYTGARGGPRSSISDFCEYEGQVSQIIGRRFRCGWGGELSQIIGLRYLRVGEAGQSQIIGR